MGWTHTHFLAVENWEGYLSYRSPNKECDIPAPHQAPQRGAPVPGRGALATSVKIGEDFVHLGEIEGCHKSRYTLKEPMCKFTHSRALTLGSGRGAMASEVPESYGGETEFCRFKVRARERAIIVLVWIPPPTWPAGSCSKNLVRISTGIVSIKKKIETIKGLVRVPRCLLGKLMPHRSMCGL